MQENAKIILYFYLKIEIITGIKIPFWDWCVVHYCNPSFLV
jgi:hypothetical protein